ncbi:MAG: hypothetical protein HPY64_14125 [Anaerolineae bacterium]|nr:hypothetical protein [Anaerolineae bacterium]
MNRSRYTVLILAVLALLVAAGCASQRAEAAQSPTPTPAPSAEVAPDQAEAAGADQAAPAVALLPAETRPDSNCIACHSDAAQLQLLAEEEEAPPSLSEGSG